MLKFKKSYAGDESFPWVCSPCQVAAKSDIKTEHISLSESDSILMSCSNPVNNKVSYETMLGRLIIMVGNITMSNLGENLVCIDISLLKKTCSMVKN